MVTCDTELSSLSFLVSTRYPVDAYWNCWGCMNKITLHAEAHFSRYSGTDNEGPPHNVVLEFYCQERFNSATIPADEVGAPPVEGSGLGIIAQEGASAGPGPATPPPPLPTIGPIPDGLGVLVDYTVRNATILMEGIIMKNTTRTYNFDIPRSIVRLCGGCVRPINLGRAWAVAGNSDGFRLKSLTTVGHFRERQGRGPNTRYVTDSGLLTINRQFTAEHANGWLDTSAFPFEENHYIKLSKAGC